MLVYLNKEKCKIFWRHERAETTLVGHTHTCSDGEVKVINGITTCILKKLETNSVISEGIAYCIAPDVYDPSIGRKESLNDLLSGLCNEYAKIIVKQFLKEISKTVKIKIPSHMVKEIREDFNNHLKFSKHRMIKNKKIL